MQIAIQGELGSFSHEAALTFDPAAGIHPCVLSAEMFRMLEAGEVDAAVAPIENSLAGSVVEHYDLLWQHDVLIEQELRLRIRHCLITMPTSQLETVHRVYSHPVALAQCRRFFAEHPGMEPIPVLRYSWQCQAIDGAARPPCRGSGQRPGIHPVWGQCDGGGHRG